MSALTGRSESGSGARGPRPSASDRGASDGRLGIFVAVALLVIAVPGALVLREMSLPSPPNLGSTAGGTSPGPASTSAVADTPDLSSPPPAISPSSAPLSVPAVPTTLVGSAVAGITVGPAHATIDQAGHFSAVFPSAPTFYELPA